MSVKMAVCLLATATLTMRSFRLVTLQRPHMVMCCLEGKAVAAHSRKHLKQDRWEAVQLCKTQTLMQYRIVFDSGCLINYLIAQSRSYHRHYTPISEYWCRMLLRTVNYNAHSIQIMRNSHHGRRKLGSA